MRRFLVLILAASALAALAVPALAARGGNPANDPRLINRPIEPSTYDYGKRCLNRTQPGTRALEGWLERNWRGVSWGTLRCEKLSRTTWSIHSEGRALDWALDAGVRAQRRAAGNLIQLLLSRDRRANTTALARRMGVQGLIYNCKSWWAGSTGLSPYDYCYRRDGKLKRNLNRTAAHRDHIHIELTWAGAKRRTSFWRSALASQ